MSAGMVDKLYFLNEIDLSEVDTIVDFGCADGSLLAAVHTLETPIKYFVGIDYNQDMIDLAKEKCNDYADFYFTLEEAFLGGIKPENSVFVLSSVVHELFTYLDPSGAFLNEFFKHGWKYICIRDMDYEEGSFYLKITEADVNNLLLEIIRYTQDKYNQIDAFVKYEKEYGKISRYTDAIHLLLKINYNENLDREIKEEYFNNIFYYSEKYGQQHSYKTVHYKRYVLPYLKNLWEKNNIHILPHVFTHIQLIYKKEN